MKSLDSYIDEALGDIIIIGKRITEEDLEEAPYSTSFMKERGMVCIEDGGVYVKIGRDEWEFQSTMLSAIGEKINTEELWRRVEKSKNVKLYKK